LATVTKHASQACERVVQVNKQLAATGSFRPKVCKNAFPNSLCFLGISLQGSPMKRFIQGKYRGQIAPKGGASILTAHI
jgi:hypothetical protein